MMHESEKAGVWGLFIGDALAMPVHWYYNPADIRTAYGGWLTGYRAPNNHHPTSILRISATGGSGRAASGVNSQKPVIGRVILHDKLDYWTGQSEANHYHQGMDAGDNTLNALVALDILKTMQRIDADGKMKPEELRAYVMQSYVLFMTTAGTHNDTYAESFHRLFFQQWSQLDHPPTHGKDILYFCTQRYASVAADCEDHQLVVVGSLVLAIPWIIHYARRPMDECARHVVEAIKLTHPAPSLMPFVELYAVTLHAVLNGTQLKEAAEVALRSPVFGRTANKTHSLMQRMADEARRHTAASDEWLGVYQEATARLGSACYIEGAMKTLLFLAHQFHDNFETGVLVNANCGGENVHRGAALGALLAANTVNNGKGLPRKLKEGLHSAKDDIYTVLGS